MRVYKVYKVETLYKVKWVLKEDGSRNQKNILVSTTKELEGIFSNPQRARMEERIKNAALPIRQLVENVKTENLDNQSWGVDLVTFYGYEVEKSIVSKKDIINKDPNGSILLMTDGKLFVCQDGMAQSAEMEK